MRFSKSFYFIMLILILPSLNQATVSTQNSSAKFPHSYLNYSTSSVFNDGGLVPTNMLKTDSSHHPLGNDITKILGNSEIVSSHWQENQSYPYHGLLSSSVLHSQDYNDTNFTWLEDFFNYTDPVGISNSGNTLVTSPHRLQIGDFDGNFRNDILDAYLRYNPDNTSSLILEFSETLSKDIKISMGGNLEMGFLLNQTYYDPTYGALPTILAGNLDNDFMSEIAFLGKDPTGVHKLWVLDDLRKSIEPLPVKFGDSINIRVMGNPSEYLFSNIGELLSLFVDGETLPQNMDFRFVDPVNPSNVSPIAIGSTIAIQDEGGLYWSVDGSGLFSLVNTNQITSNEIFTITDQELSEENNYYLNDLSTITLKTHLGSFLYFAGTMGSLIYNSNDERVNHIPYYFRLNSPSALLTSYSLGLLNLDQIVIPNFEFPMYPFGEGFKYDTSEIIAFGDVDGDGLNEIILVGLDQDFIPNVWILDDKNAGYTLIDTMGFPSFSNTNVNLAIGNLDSDGLDEIALSFTGGGVGEIQIFDLLGSSLVKKISGISNPTLSSETPSIMVGDISNDGINELLFLNQDAVLFVYNGESNNFNLLGSMDLFNGVVGAYNFSYPSMAFGDLNSDGYNELLISGAFDTSVYSVIVDYQAQLNAIAYDFQIFTTITIPNNKIRDLTGDYTLIEYTEITEVRKTSKQAILASVTVPTLTGTSQNSASNLVEFGINILGAPATNNFIEVSYGTSILVDKLSFIGENSFFKSIQQVLQVEMDAPIELLLRSLELDWDGNNNYVLYSEAEITSYIYAIRQAPDPREQDSFFYLQLPAIPSLVIESQEVYQTNLDPNSFDTANLFHSEVGDLHSYPSEDTFQDMESISLSEEASIGQGTGTTNLNVNSVGFASNILSADIEGLTSLGVPERLDSWSMSLSSNGYYSNRIGSNTVFSSETSNIPDSDIFNDNKYNFGMALYPVFSQKPNTIQRIFVIDFWTDASQGSNKTGEVTKAAGAINSLADKLPGFVMFDLILLIPIVWVLRRKLYG